MKSKRRGCFLFRSGGGKHGLLKRTYTENLVENDTACPGALPSPGILTLTSACLVSLAQQKHSPRADGHQLPLQPGQEGGKDLYLPVPGACAGMERTGRLGQSCGHEGRTGRVLVPTLPFPETSCLCPLRVGGQGVLPSSWAQALLEDFGRSQMFEGKNPGPHPWAACFLQHSPFLLPSLRPPTSIHFHTVPCASHSPCFPERSQ